MLPAQQRLEAPEIAIGKGHLRLIHQAEILYLDGIAHAVFKHQPRAGATIELLIIEAVLLATCLLGCIHRRVGRAQQAFDITPAVREGGDADADAQADVDAVHLLLDRHPLEQFFGIAPGLLRVGQAVEQCGELVAAQTCQQRLAAQAFLDLLGHPEQHPVTRFVAQRIVDPLEAIEVHVHQGLGLVRTLAAQQRAFGGLVETATVEQPGQRVGHRLVFELLMQVTLHRHVQHRDHHGLLLRR